MGFVACTNEVEEFGVQQNPTEAAKGIELGEGFKINVAYSGTEADADTRAVLERNEANTGWKASWQTGDKIGAAMYSMITGKYTSGTNAGKVSGLINFLEANNIYASNNEFSYVENESGITFESLSNSMVGAYLLYYPYNSALNNSAAFGEIPVYTSAEKATYKLTFDVKNIGAEVSNRIFAANVAYFKEGGNQAPEFTVKQVPNLYMIKFSIAEKLQMAFTDEMQIEQIIVEANNSGSKVFNTNGIVKPVNVNPNASAFDYYKQTIDGTYYSLGDIDFVGDEATRTESLIVKPVYEGADEATIAPYVITESGDAGKTAPFYFSVLPTEGLTNEGEVTFTIIASVGNEQKVFSKTYNKDWKSFGTLVEKMQAMGETINLNVVLDTEDNLAGKIYTPEQFLAAYANNQQVFDFAIDMTLDTNIEAVKDLTFSGKPVIINGDVIAHGKTITFNNHVKVEGKVEAKTITNKDESTTAGKVAFNGEATEDEVTCSAEITGDITVEGAGSEVTAKNKISAANVTATNGSINIKNAEVANITAIGATIKTGEISAAVVSATNEADVTFGKATLSGAVTADNSIVKIAEGSTLPSFTATDATAEIAGTVSGKVIATDSEVTIAGTVSDAVEATNSEVTINGTVNSLSATDSKVGGVTKVNGKYELIGSTTDKNSQVEAGEISVDQNSAFTAKALNAGTMTVNGIATATGVNIIKTLNVEPNAEVTLTGKNVKTSKVENVNVKKNETTGKYGILNISKNLPLYNVANDGEINADAAIIASGANNAILTGSFTVIGTFDQNANADGTTVTVNGETAVLNINKTTALANLTNNAIVNIAAKSELTFDEATNNGEINVAGTLTETTKNTLTMTEDATISALKGATLTMGKGNKKKGTVYVENGTKALTYVNATYFTAVVYKWNKTVAPDANALAAINTIIAEEGATLNSTAAAKTYLILKGNVTLAEDLSITATKNLTVDGDVTIKGKTAGRKLTLTNGLTNKFVVTSGSSLTLGDNNVTLGGKTWNHDSDDTTPAINSQLIVEDGASFTGNDNEIKNLDIKYNM